MASWWYRKFRTPAPWFNIKMTSYQYKKSHSGDRRSDDRLISTMGFPVLVRLHLYIESGPWWQASYGPYHSLELPNHGIRHVMCCTSSQCSVVLSRDPSDWWLKPDQASRAIMSWCPNWGPQTETARDWWSNSLAATHMTVTHEWRQLFSIIIQNNTIQFS